MTGFWSVLRREYGSMFRVPLGWVVIALFLLLSGYVFLSRTLVEGEPASMRDSFGMWWLLLLFVAPAISMRLLSEEQRTGTLEVVLTSPVSEWVVVLGKYGASVLFLLTMLAPTLVYVGILVWVSGGSGGRVDLGMIASGYAGLVLLGMVYLSVGTLASSLTSSQTLAFLVTLIVLVLLEVGPDLVVSSLPWRVPDGVLVWVQDLSLYRRSVEFSTGLMRLESVVYLLSVSAWFCAAAGVVLASRRWR